MLELSIDNSEIITRLSGRRTCRGCGKVFPSSAPQCDSCGGELYQRDDDRPEAVANRLDVYDAQTSPLIEYYESRGLLRRVDGALSLDEVQAQVVEALA